MRFSNIRTSNRLIGIIMLIMLLVLIGPNTLPRLLSRTLPFADEGVPCSRLMQAQDRANHQSLIGRLAEQPLSLSIQADTLPTSPDGSLIIRVTIINNTIGTIPVVYNPSQVIVGDNGSSGLGIIFEPTNSLNTGGSRPNAAVVTIPESDIRLLGPRQRCVHRVEFLASQLDGAVTSGTALVRAYYRVTATGTVVSTTVATPIYDDQGLRVQNGYIESSPVPILLPNAAQP